MGKGKRRTLQLMPSACLEQRSFPQAETPATLEMDLLFTIFME